MKFDVEAHNETSDADVNLALDTEGWALAYNSGVLSPLLYWSCGHSTARGLDLLPHA